MDDKKKNFKTVDKRTLLKEVFKTLQFIFVDGTFMDKAMEKTMRNNKKWKVRERSFVAETIYDLVRNWRLILTCADTKAELSEHNWKTIYGTWLVIKGEELPETAEYKDINESKIISLLKKYEHIRKIWESYPDWLDERCERELGAAQWNKLAPALNHNASMVLRANSLKTNVPELQTTLAEVGIETETLPWAPEALQLKFSRNVFRYEPFKNGWFEVQDPASQMVADFLGAKPGMRVVDACAGAGGKTLHLAAMMKNKGNIIALDTKEFKLAELKKRAKRAGAAIVECRVIDSTKVVKRLKDSADRLLLDVPCSGLGVLRRNPDTKWMLKPEEIDNVIRTQREILERFSPITKVGGMMVYATCSILPSEGKEQIQWFLQNNAGWTLEGEKQYSPLAFDCDGFYMALMKRIS
ncbi:MAG: RsmB/NOP family class I SAM-dependent RNA methyltransferase [Bacteroidetes bacterium]|nr:RsmB/NOP family class I SAM-dependent RNA methyltransferase [Bacteroidota bacterium]